MLKNGQIYNNVEEKLVKTVKDIGARIHILSYCKGRQYFFGYQLNFVFLLLSLSTLYFFPVWLFELVSNTSFYANFANMSTCWPWNAINYSDIEHFAESKLAASSERNMFLLLLSFILQSFHEIWYIGTLWEYVKPHFRKASSFHFMLQKWHGIFSGNKSSKCSIENWDSPTDAVTQHVSLQETNDMYRSTDTEQAKKKMNKNLHDFANNANSNHKSSGKKSDGDKPKSEAKYDLSSGQVSGLLADGKGSETTVRQPDRSPEPIPCSDDQGNVQATPPSNNHEFDQLSLGKACVIHRCNHKNMLYRLNPYFLMLPRLATFFIPKIWNDHTTELILQCSR